MTQSLLFKRAFSLLEVLTVISVMIILTGILLPSLRMARIRAFEAKTKAQLVALKLAVNLYKNDMGHFPKKLNRQNLMDGPPQKKQWKGPYLEIKNADFDKEGNILDAWGQKFKYMIHKRLNHGHYFNITSFGKDIVFDTNDDIDLWKG